MKYDPETYEFDPDKKEHINRYALEKLLKEIKSLLSKGKLVKIVVSAE
jgi:hypothetical protein